MNRRHVFETPVAAAEACGQAIFESLKGAIALNGKASVAFSGGSTPKLMFEWMAKQPFDWKPVHIFWVDERCVPLDHADSNYRMTREALLDHISPGSIHRIEGELSPEEAASKYRDDLRSFFGGIPHFDVVHLGMGADAHTASLFPGLKNEIEDRSGIAANVWVEKLGKPRVTLLPASILDAQHVVMLVAGQDKAAPLKQVFTAAYDPVSFPTQFVQRNARVLDWYLDRAAATDIS